MLVSRVLVANVFATSARNARCGVEFFHQRRGIVATVAQNINGSERQGAIRETQFLLSQ